MRDRERFYQNLLGLAETYGEELSKMRIMIYERALSGFADDAVERAMMQAVASMRWFPKPVELIELLEGKRENAALLAWEQLQEALKRAGPMDSVRFEDGKIARVVEFLGGWIRVCSWTEEELPYRRREFLACYAGLPGCNGPETLPGLVEAHNSAHGFPDMIPEPVRIGANGSCDLVEKQPRQLIAGMKSG